MNKKEARKILLGLAFLLPNISGFLAFMAIPLLMSLVMAFTNWNLELHNVFRNEPIQFVGLQNFVRLFTEPDFFRYLRNTLFFMMGIPFGVAGSLCAALLLSSNFSGGSRKVWATVFVTILLTVSLWALIVVGAGGTAMTILFTGLVGLILVGGSAGGQSVYRTLFYFPHFTSGVATYILWKKLYSPENGPINQGLRPVLESVAPKVNAMPAGIWTAVSLLLLLGMIGLYVHEVRKKLRDWRDGDSGTLSLVLATLLVSIPLLAARNWIPFTGWGWVAPLIAAAGAGVLIRVVFRGRDYTCTLDDGLSDAVVLCGAAMVGMFILLGLSRVAHGLPAMAADGLEPPKWIADYYWAKPSIMLMGFWGSIGSNNMLLYLAGISNVSPELYEAADIDGASPKQRFWYVTWPQLSNITFFILVMACIGGLQGGFEMARTMTQGGPAGATTTLSYYVYVEGFATGRLGYASAVAWTLFCMILVITLFNWRFGNRYTND
ncbi:MAG: sugar ABC transporter permease [Kiritimatiellae bacterium]|jgi:multiple sugar transport system permease protein|nr:sugar ABC transporter permease [Kiritimatiellia bacterium]